MKKILIIAAVILACAALVRDGAYGTGPHGNPCPHRDHSSDSRPDRNESHDP